MAEGLSDELYFLGQDLPPFASTPLPFEKAFDYKGAHTWMMRNWALSVYIGVAYLGVVVTLQQWMRDRKPFDLSWALFSWNAALAVFSIVGTVRAVPEFLRILSMEDGYHRSICEFKTTHSPAGTLWAFVFVWSKAIELGDTIFIILRKRQLTFLQVYHHFSVLIFCWYSTSLVPMPTARWFATMNYFVHSIMYTYFAIQSVRLFKIPKPISMSITLLQIAQMIAGIVVNLHAYNTKRRGEPCAVTDDLLNAAAVIYSSYFLLFAWFFYTAYFRTTGKGAVRGKKMKSM